MCNIGHFCISLPLRCRIQECHPTSLSSLLDLRTKLTRNTVNSDEHAPAHYAHGIGTETRERTQAEWRLCITSPLLTPLLPWRLLLALKQRLARAALCDCGSHQNRSNYLGPTNTTLRVKRRNELILNVNIRLSPREYICTFSLLLVFQFHYFLLR